MQNKKTRLYLIEAVHTKNSPIPLHNTSNKKTEQSKLPFPPTAILVRTLKYGTLHATNTASSKNIRAHAL